MTTTLQVSCKQTRFQVENPSYREIDVEGLNISFFLKPHPGKCGKKGHAHGFNTSEILTDATLRLKPGERYALIGRNGSGKSTLMRAIAEKLIPGMPEAARISILQQTRSENDSRPTANKGTRRTVLEEVIERATAKDELEQEIDGKNLRNYTEMPSAKLTISSLTRCCRDRRGSGAGIASAPA